MLFRRFAALIALVSTMLVASVGLAANKTVNVKFPRGSSGTTISDSIRGYDGIRYRIGVTAGQRMSVQLDTNNTSNYFNITGPGASAAMFNGSMDGNSTTFEVPSSGTWVIDVYLMRNAARRNERARFDLTLYVEGKAAAVAPRPVAPVYDGNESGPDYWDVTGLSAGDTLNIRVSASTSASIVGTLRNGDRVRNLGCAMSGGMRWCHIDAGRNRFGWVAGRYLHESYGTAPATTLPALPVRPIPVPSVDTVDVASMPRFCAGEASAKFGVRPRDITTNMAFKSGNRYVSQGWFDRDGGSTFFNCWFGLDGSFQSVN